jgi:RNA polymerase sigma-70 factor (ECF subfamily)
VAEDGYVREVYEASYRRLVAQAYAVAADRVEAEDAVQEAFARAVAAGDRFRRLDNPEAWLRTVALNVLRRRWRRASMFRALSPRLATASAVPGNSEDHVAVVAALRSLPFQQRETLALFYLGDLSVQEIAATLGVADGTVKSRLTRGRTALAGLLDTTLEAERG